MIRNSQYDLALDDLAEILPDNNSVEEAYETKELKVAINGFVATLNPSDRFLFIRRYWYSDPVKDIAKMAHSTTNSVTVRLFRIRKKLKLYLEKEGLLV